MTQTICAVGQDGTCEPNFRLDRLLSGIKLIIALAACKWVRRPNLFVIFDGFFIESLVGYTCICYNADSIRN